MMKAAIDGEEGGLLKENSFQIPQTEDVDESRRLHVFGCARSDSELLFVQVSYSLYFGHFYM